MIAHLSTKYLLFFQMALANMEKGEYEKAMSLMEDACGVHPDVLDTMLPDGRNFSEACQMSLAACLAELGRFEEAEAEIAPFLEKSYDSATVRVSINEVLFTMAALRKDACEARRLVQLMSADFVKLDKEYSSIWNDGRFLQNFSLYDAMTDKLENRSEEARAKLEDIVQNCRDYGIHRMAIKELEKLNSVSKP
jgi:tetratricopeptide (TPR) repeat protein